MLAQFDGGLLE